MAVTKHMVAQGESHLLEQQIDDAIVNDLSF